MRKMEENMGIFKDDEEKTTENVSLPEDLNLDDIGDDLGSLFDEDKTDDADDNVDKDLLSQIFSDGGDVSESDDKTSDGEMDEDLSKLLGEIEDIEDVAKESAAKEAEKKTASNHKKNNKKADKVKENKTAHMDAPGEVSDDTVTVILGDKGKVLSIIKPGGKAVKEELIMLLRAKASDRYNAIYEELEKFKASLPSQMETEYSVCFHEMSKNP